MFTKHSAGSRGRSRPAVWAIVWVVCAAVGAAHGMPPRPDPVVAVDCDSGDSINNALRRADPNHIEVVVSGVCHEAVVISRSDVLIRAVGLGAHGIQGMEGAPALELHHVSNVAIQGLFISGGDVGILVTDSNHRISLSDLVVSENLAGGMTLEDASVSGSNLRVEANGQTPATAGVLVDHGSEFTATAVPFTATVCHRGPRFGYARQARQTFPTAASPGSAHSSWQAIRPSPRWTAKSVSALTPRSPWRSSTIPSRNCSTQALPMAYSSPVAAASACSEARTSQTEAKRWPSSRLRDRHTSNCAS